MVVLYLYCKWNKPILHYITNMKLNVITILNEIEVENQSEKLIKEFYELVSSDADYRMAYDYEMHLIEMCNNQTWEMVHFYESRYGLDYVNNELNWHIDEIPTFEEWLEELKSKVTFVY